MVGTPLARYGFMSDIDHYRRQTAAIGTITPSGNLVVERVTTAILADFPHVSGH